MKDEYEIQGRFLPGFETSWPQAVAIKVGNDIVEVQSVRAERASRNGTTTPINSLKIWVNGRRNDVGTSKTDASISRGIALPGGGNILVRRTTSTNISTFPTSVLVIWPKKSKSKSIGVILNVAFKGNPFIDVDILKPSRSFSGQQRGLLGNDDGNPKNDFIRRNGQILGEDHNLSFTELYGLFGTDWLVRPYESLFRNPEAIKAEFPTSPVTLTPEQRAFGEEACMGLIGFYYESCVLDVGLTGSITLVEEYYSNTEDLNSFSEQIVEPNVNRAFYTMDVLTREKFSDSNLTHAHYKQKISIKKKSGEGKFILLVRPPKGATATLETGRGSYVAEGNFNTSVMVNCQELNETTNRDLYRKEGAIQLWSVDPLSGTLGHLYKSVKLSCSSELEGLVAHWSFDDCTAKDNSGNGLDGEVHGNMECVDGIYGKAFKFDGNDDYISINFPLDGKKDWSMCTWFNLENKNNGNNYQTFISDSTFALDFYIPSLNYVVWQAKQQLNFGKVEEHEDTFVCYTKHDKNLTLYIDSVKVGETINANKINFNNLTQIGRYSSSTEHFNGVLDEMKFFNRGLSLEEINYLYKFEGRRLFVNLNQSKIIVKGESVTFDIKESSSNIMQYEWKKGNRILSTDSNFTSNDFSIGTHIITLSVRDIFGEIFKKDITLTVEPQKILEIHNLYDDNGEFIKKVDTFYLSGDYNYSFLLKSGTIVIENNTTINGDLLQSGGILNMSSSNLIVKGDYRLQTPNSDGTYSESGGELRMTNIEDYLLVEGNFVTDANKRHFTSLTAGILEIKGDFTQLSTYGDSSYDGVYNFPAKGRHIVRLSGTTQQMIHFDDSSTNRSYFNILEITNRLIDGIDFKTEVYVTQWILNQDINFKDSITVNGLIDLNGHIFSIDGDLNTSANIKINGGKLNIKENLYIKAGTFSIMLKEGEVIVFGDLIQSGGALEIDIGKLIVKGDYRIQKLKQTGFYTYSSGILKMLGKKSYLLVEGDFVTDSTERQFSYLAFGIFELKGNFTQMSTDKHYLSSGKYNFSPSESHIMKFSGDKKQIVTFEDILYTNYGHFGSIELENLSIEGLEFKRGVIVLGVFNHHNNIFQINDTVESFFQDSDFDTVKDDLDQYPLDRTRVGIPPNTIKLILPIDSIVMNKLDKNQIFFTINHNLKNNLDVLVELDNVNLADLSNSWDYEILDSRYYTDNNLSIIINPKEIGTGRITFKVIDEKNNELLRIIPLSILDKK